MSPEDYIDTTRLLDFAGSDLTEEEGEQKVIAKATEDCSEAEWNRICDALRVSLFKMEQGRQTRGPAWSCCVLVCMLSILGRRLQGLALRHYPKKSVDLANYRYPRLPQHMRHLGLPQPRSVILKRQMLLVLIYAKLPQPIGVRERPQTLQLFLIQRRLQFVCNFNKCHGPALYRN